MSSAMATFALLQVATILVTALGPVLSLSEGHTTYRTGSGNVCNKCPKGTRVVEDCYEDFTDSTCEPCPPHQYMDELNGKRHCKACITSCPKAGVAVQACSPTTNMVCHCTEGFHQHPLDAIDNKFECLRHTNCSTGFGEKHAGNHTHDRQCEECEEGRQFRNQSGPGHPRCEDCLVCPPGSEIVSNCTMSANTVCRDNSTITTAAPGTDDGLAPGVIVGIVFPVLVLFVVVLWLGIWCRRRHVQSRQRDVERATSPGGDVPLLPAWSMQFIERKVFPYLGRQLGNEWRDFILRLPGWPADCSVNAVIDHKIEEEVVVRNRIIGCLNEWVKRAMQDFVCKESIIKTLIDVERAELVQNLDDMASDVRPAANGVQNGQ